MKKRKNIFMVILAFGIVFLPMALPASAQAAKQQNTIIHAKKVPITMTSQTATPGKKATVKILVGRSQGICAMDLYVDYNDKKLTYLSGKQGSRLGSSAMALIGEPNGENRVSFSYVDMGTGIKRKITVLEITFRVKKKAKGRAKCKLSVGSFADFEAEPVAYKITQGGVKIKKQKKK